MLRGSRRRSMHSHMLAAIRVAWDVDDVSAQRSMRRAHPSYR